VSNDREPEGQTDPGRHFFAYFLVAADKKVSRHKGEKTKLKK
jgi:hypothetical protein